MTKKKQLKQQKKFSKDLALKAHYPELTLAHDPTVAEALAKSLVKGDREAFMEILAAHLITINKLQLEREQGLSRRTIYNLLKKDANPTLETVFKLLKAG